MIQKTKPPLPYSLRPSLLTVSLPYGGIEALVEAEAELKKKAAADSNGCFGYFPGLAGMEGIDTDLPACKFFAATVPELVINGTVVGFNFLRYANRRQETEPVFHIDTDAKSALTGNLLTVRRRLVRRLLLNLSPDYARHVSYVDVPLDAVELEAQGAYLGLKGPEEYGDQVVTVGIPPRNRCLVHGLNFVSNFVLHSGKDEPIGHFLAGYGYETQLNTALT